MFKPMAFVSMDTPTPLKDGMVNEVIGWIRKEKRSVPMTIIFVIVMAQVCDIWSFGLQKKVNRTSTIR